MRIIIILLVLLFTGIHCKSQEGDHQLWMNYALTVPINKNLSYGGDVGLRGFGSNIEWNQILIRPAITYRFKYPLSIAGAIAWFRTANRNGFNVNEFRIHQDFNLKWPDLGFLELFYRVRVEERLFYYEEIIPNSFNVRIRGLVGIESQDFTWFGKKRPIYFQAIYEGFKNAGKDDAYELFVNQVRLHFAFGHRLTKGFRYELHYIAQRSRLFSDIGLETTQNVYRIRLYHVLGTD